MKTNIVWVFTAAAVFLSSAYDIRAQDPADRDQWNVSEGSWGDDDNWVDDADALSGTPTFDDDRWALVDSGTATVTGDHRTSGLTIGNAEVVVTSGASLEVAIQDDAFSVGQTSVGNRGTLRLEGNGSYKGLSGSILGTLELDHSSKFELSADATLQGNLSFQVSSTGSPLVAIGGEATIGGTIAPSFIDRGLSFGDNIKFVEAGEITLTQPTLSLPNDIRLPRGLQASLVSDDRSLSIQVTNVPILQVDRASSQAKILNIAGGPLEMTGYVIESQSGKLNPDGFTGFGGTGWDRPNPLSTTMAEFSLTESQTVQVNDTLEIGNIYNGGDTLPIDEDVVFRYFTPQGDAIDGLVDYVGPANDLVLNANPETGEVTIQHLSEFVDPIEVTGYSVASASSSLKVDAWTSLEKAGQSGWLEANPAAGIISEVNPSESLIFSNGTVVSLGNIFDPDGPRDLVLEYTTTDEFRHATVEYQASLGSTPQFLEADFDQNGTVEFADFLTLSGQFSQTVDPPGTPPDINGDGVVNFPDFLVLSEQFGRSSNASPVPEPSGLPVILSAVLPVLAMRRRRSCRFHQPSRNVGQLDQEQDRRGFGKEKIMRYLCFVVGTLVFATPVGAVEDFTVSNFGDGSQIWWEAEHFDERIPDNDDHFVLELPPIGEEAFGDDEFNTINRIGAGGRLSYTFDISQLGQAGTWYFWGRVLNPNNLSDFMLVEGHPGDVIPVEEPFSGSFSNEQRVFERNTGPPFGWSGGGEGHVKQLQNGVNTMHFVHRQATSEVFWDVMMWTDDPDYVPTDEDYLDSQPLVLIENPGDFNGDSAINFADYLILVENFNTDVERGMDGDITFNGHVDYRDFLKFRTTFESQQAGAAAVPEPDSGVLAVAALLCFGLCRRRRLTQIKCGGRPTTCASLWSAAIIGCLMASSAQAQTVIKQEPGTDYLAFEAEDYFELVNGDDATGWGPVGVNDPFITDDGIPVLGQSTTAFRRQAMFDFPGGNDQDFMRYRLEFVEDGDYSLYLRFTMFNIQGDAGFGNEDSIYVSSEFGVDGELIETFADPRGNRDASPSFYGVLPKGDRFQHGNFGWWNADADGSDPTADNPDAIYFPDLETQLDFGIAARERGVVIDKVVFHTNPSLSDEELDAIPSFDPFTLGILPGDFNEDGTVDFADLTLMRENFGLTFAVAESYGKGDQTRDGKVDLRDFLEFRQTFNQPAGARSVPEPSAIHILLVTVYCMFVAGRPTRKSGRG